MQVKKQDVNVGKAVFSGDIKSSAEGSVIVPDIKPDILKVVQVDAESILEEKSVENGKVVLKGKVYINVLYIPENESEHIQSLSGTLDFLETYKKSEFEQGMNITATCDTGKVGYKLINSRKLGFEAQVVVNVSVTSNMNLSFIYDIDSDKAEFITDNISIKEVCNQKEFICSIEETVDLTNNNVLEILKSNAFITEKECRSITGKIIAKGKANATILYVTEKGNYEHVDFDMPFTEVFDWESVDEDYECELDYEIIETQFKLTESQDGDKKSISAYIQIRVTASIEKIRNLQYIKDCYFTNALCDFEYENTICEEICAKPMFSTLVKNIIEKDDSFPDISRIYTSLAKPQITSTDVQNGRISVSGKITVCVLYLSDDAQIPLSGLVEEIPFSHIIECDEASSDKDVLLKIECEHISCTLNSSSSIEARCGICIKGKVIKRYNIQTIKDLTYKGNIERDEAMIIYFTKENDSVWDIGKMYHVKCQDIKECNKLDGENKLRSGQKIVIPVSK